jgi:hypothetical protein
MKKAIIWLCWGTHFVEEAATSARSAAAIQADRFLITDAEGAAAAKDMTEFTSIIPIELLHRNNLEKSRLIDFLPAGYETFLYLDTDTRIVGDVGFGFEKAQRHGIAMAPAPNYNLAEFFGFGEIMIRLGVQPADQLMYNAGVIFFQLTPTVRRVLERWRDLCKEVGAKLDFPRDQPFLTLAMEQLDFVPYALSPLYNYRSLGEYAVGNIRLWHSHFAPPSDVNVFANAWPARRFSDGKRLSSDADAPPQLPQPPQGMLRLTLHQFTQRKAKAEARSIAADAVALQRSHGSRAANDFLMARIGVRGSPDNNEPYFAEALHFHLGLLYAHAQDPEQMATHLRLSCSMPTGDDDELFSDHVNIARVLRLRQTAAVKRGIPPILIACMPRSASATLTHTLGRALGCPVMHLSAGRFPDYFLVPSWLDMFREGGAITQDHFAANEFNLGVLRDRGPLDLFVLARDPRAAARSQVHFLARDESEPDQSLSERITHECMAHFIPWLQSWIDCARRPDPPLRIHWLTYREVCASPAAVLRRVSGVLSDRHPAMRAYLACQSLEEVRVHFETGNDTAWRGEVDTKTRERLWAACTPDIRSLLDLEP